MNAETVSSIALIVSVISFLFSWSNRGKDQKVRVAEKLSELVILIGQLQIALQQQQIELSEATERTKEANEGFSLRFDAMYKNIEGTLSELSTMREKAETLQTILPPSKVIIEIERMRSNLAVQQAQVVHLLQETRELSTLISNTDYEN